MKRIIDISNGPTRVRIDNGLLLIETATKNHIPLDQIDTIIIAHPAVSLTGAALATLAENNIPVVFCNRSYIPVGSLSPYSTASLGAKRVRQQILLSHEVSQSLWKKIIETKVSNQATILSQHGLKDESDKIKSYLNSYKEISFLESQSARVYFSALFETGFNRRDEGFSENHVLNYAYALLRSRVSRTICASGLNPIFGINHSNKYNAFALSDDLMEPWRPLFDLKVLKCKSKLDTPIELNKDIKEDLIEFSNERIKIKKESRTVADWIERSIRSCCLIIISENSIDSLELPTLE